MKRIALVVLLFAPVVLAGCQTLKAYNPFGQSEPNYQAAQQKQPLEVPPGMDQPPTAEALVIPNAGAANAGAAPQAVPAMQAAPEAPPAAAAAAAPAPAAPAPLATSAGGTNLSLADTPASAFHRVGLALERGEIGQVVARDDTAMTYQVAVDTVVTQKSEGGFFHRMFHHDKNEVVKGTVTVSVVPQGAGSLVAAAGDPAAAARVIALLQQRLH